MSARGDRFPFRWVRLRSWITRRPVQAATIFVGLFLLLDWVAIDRWQVTGQVVDATTDEGIPDVWVLANFYGEEPLVNLPIPPHPNHRTSVCMGTRITRTDSFGRFSFDTLTTNRPLAEKRASLIGFKPRGLVHRGSTEITSSLVGWPSKLDLLLEVADEARQHTPSIGYTDAETLPAFEHTYSNDLLETVLLISLQTCGHEGLALPAAAMSYALTIAETFDERSRVRSACRYARRRTEHSNEEHSEWDGFVGQDPKYIWPFDCENLPFKKQPSAEALAVEAEIAAQRRTRKLDDSKEGSP